jgi:hypothetical protein
MIEVRINDLQAIYEALRDLIKFSALIEKKFIIFLSTDSEIFKYNNNEDKPDFDLSFFITNPCSNSNPCLVTA